MLARDHERAWVTIYIYIFFLTKQALFSMGVPPVEYRALFLALYFPLPYVGQVIRQDGEKTWYYVLSLTLTANISRVELKQWWRADTELTLIYICKINFPDLSVFNMKRIQNFRVKNLCERSLYQPGCNSLLLPHRRPKLKICCVKAGWSRNRGKPRAEVRVRAQVIHGNVTIFIHLKLPNRSQKRSKFGKNVSDTLGYRLVCQSFHTLWYIIEERSAIWDLFAR